MLLMTLRLQRDFNLAQTSSWPRKYLAPMMSRDRRPDFISSPETSTVSNTDSGYGSIDTDDGPECSLNHCRDARQSSKSLGKTTNPVLECSGGQGTSQATIVPQRTFDGQVVVDATMIQVQRYNEILEYITPPLNRCLQQRGKLRARSKSKRVDAVRLIVMGPDRETARPNIVFFCSPGVEKVIKELLEKPAYQKIFQGEGQDDISFSYRAVSSGITLRSSRSQFSVEIPDVGFMSANGIGNTSCGTPIRLYNRDLEEWRRATLGGVLKVTAKSGEFEYYAMTAGHFLDDWEDDNDQATDSDLEEDEIYVESSYGVQVDDKAPSIASAASSEEASPWDFGQSMRIGDLVTAHSKSSTPFTKHYFDWALFKLDKREMNAVMRESETAPSLVHISSVAPTAIGFEGRPVVVASASCGPMDGIVQAGMAKMAIGPGQEVVDAYVISLGANRESSR